MCYDAGMPGKCHLILFSLAVSLLAPLPLMADLDEASIKRRGNGPRALSEKGLANVINKEMEALVQGADLLRQVDDEKSAKEVSKKLKQMFSPLPPIMNGNVAQLEALSVAQNKINLQMEALKNEPYFISSGLQEAWTIITHPFARRSAQR